jgi:hypothetical protein
VAPFIVDLLSLIDHGLPNLVIGALTVSAVVPFFFLPETANKDIPESIEDMNRWLFYGPYKLECLALAGFSILAQCL